MKKIRIVFADTDNKYLEKLSDFFAENYTDRFKVSCFSKAEALQKLIKESSSKPDILAVSPCFLDDFILSCTGFTKIILTEGKVPPADNCALARVNKYQHADRIISDILSVYSNSLDSPCIPPAGSRKTKTAIVCSPAGGTGKTSIAVTLCIQCVREGLSTFLLSLDAPGSISLYMKDEDISRSISSILYHIRCNSTDIPIRIESSKSIDSYHGVHYFSPPECDLEIINTNTEDLMLLLKGIRDMSVYDVLVVDMPSCISIKAPELFTLADTAFVILCPDASCIHKASRWREQMPVLFKQLDFEPFERMKVIVNKCRALDTEAFNLPGYNTDYALPVFSDTVQGVNLPSLLSPSNPFGRGIQDIVRNSLVRGNVN